MPVYNAMDFLEMSIQSIANQTFNDLELICVDDGSTDGSLDYLKELKEKYPFIRIIEQQNQGSGKARNNGMKNAKGEYIGFLDSDDIFIDENALEEMYRFGKENDANIVSANLKFLELDGTISDNPHYEAHDYAEFFDYENIHPEKYGIPYAFYKCIFKNVFLKEHNIVFPDLSRGQDPIFMANALINSGGVCTVPLDLYGYNHEQGGGVNAKINAFDKKFDYIQHFKDTYDILADGGLQDTANFYKIHLFRFLTWNENFHDRELFEIFNEIWGVDNDSFDKTDFNYSRFIVPAKFYFLNKIDTEEYFYKVNSDFLQINIYDTYGVDEKIIDMYFLVIYSYSFDDFKANYAKLLNDNLIFKKEFGKFKVNKFLFNLSINGTPVVKDNARIVFNSCPVWSEESFSKNNIKKCYRIITEDQSD